MQLCNSCRTPTRLLCNKLKLITTNTMCNCGMDFQKGDRVMKGANGQRGTFLGYVNPSHNKSKCVVLWDAPAKQTANVLSERVSTSCSESCDHGMPEVCKPKQIACVKMEPLCKPCNHRCTSYGRESEDIESENLSQQRSKSHGKAARTNSNVTLHTSRALDSFTRHIHNCSKAGAFHHTPCTHRD